MSTLDLNDHSVHSRHIDEVKISQVRAFTYHSDHSIANSNSEDNSKL